MEDRRKIFISEYRLPKGFDIESSKETVKVGDVTYYYVELFDTKFKSKYLIKNLTGTESGEQIALYY